MNKLFTVGVTTLLGATLIAPIASVSAAPINDSTESRLQITAGDITLSSPTRFDFGTVTAGADAGTINMTQKTNATPVAMLGVTDLRAGGSGATPNDGWYVTATATQLAKGAEGLSMSSLTADFGDETGNATGNMVGSGGSVELYAGSPTPIVFTGTADPSSRSEHITSTIDATLTHGLLDVQSAGLYSGNINFTLTDAPAP